MQAKTKHIKIKHHYIKEITQARDLISTRQQLTNLVIKPLGPVDDATQLSLKEKHVFSTTLCD